MNRILKSLFLGVLMISSLTACPGKDNNHSAAVTPPPGGATIPNPCPFGQFPGPNGACVDGYNSPYGGFYYAGHMSIVNEMMADDIIDNVRGTCPFTKTCGVKTDRGYVTLQGAPTPYGMMYQVLIQIGSVDGFFTAGTADIAGQGYARAINNNAGVEITMDYPYRRWTFTITSNNNPLNGAGSTSYQSFNVPGVTVKLNGSPLGTVTLRRTY